MDVACFFPVSVYGVTCFFPVCHCGCCLFLPNVSLLFVSSSCVFVELVFFFKLGLNANWSGVFLHCDSSVLLPLSSLCSFVECFNCLFLHVCGCGMMFISADWLDTFLHCVSFFTGCVYGVFFLSLWSVVNFFTKCLCWTLSFIFLNCLWEVFFFFFSTVFFKSSFCCCFHLFLIFYGMFYGFLLGLPWYNCNC